MPVRRRMLPLSTRRLHSETYWSPTRDADDSLRPSQCAAIAAGHPVLHSLRLYKAGCAKPPDARQAARTATFNKRIRFIQRSPYADSVTSPTGV